MKPPNQSWLVDGLILAPSSIDGVGLFTSRPFSKGELLIVWGGIVFTRADIESGKGRRHTIVAIDEGLYLANPAEKNPDIDDFVNHSCNPNIWMRDAISIEAARDILAGEELVADYAIWLDDPEYVMNKPCNCGAPWCRRRITGRDWLLPEVQERNYPHFSPFLNRRIKQLKEDAKGRIENSVDRRS